MTNLVKAVARQRGQKLAAACCRPEENLRRFGRPLRRNVQCLAARHERLADLAVAFPGLLAALAAPRLGFKPAEAIAAVAAGRPLAELARLASIPLWLRKLPPEAFAAAVPLLPDGDLFRRRIANHLPKSRSLAREWLQGVADAYAISHEPFALWIAKILQRDGKLGRKFSLERVGVWAWFSVQEEGEAAGLIRERWHPGMDQVAASRHAANWRDRLEYHWTIAVYRPQRPWLQPGVFDGYEFVPLLSFEDLVVEGREMNHCVADYTTQAAEGTAQFWSMRKLEKRVATVELRTAPGDCLVCISEIRAQKNAMVPLEVSLAARRWLNSHAMEALVRAEEVSREAELLKSAQQFWKPYWLAKRNFPPWLPLDYCYLL